MAVDLTLASFLLVGLDLLSSLYKASAKDTSKVLPIFMSLRRLNIGIWSLLIQLYVTSALFLAPCFTQIFDVLTCTT
ncbi:uncharacterized protein EV420DRAFT_1545760 [Desarmillaria tabescens]|uniref:Uncharacterized protein n=1 Tax=Armillaria tabescens TaxID=1929756 RepID=A0AA39KBA6_ARMTA|nr:uncharacterized protein EV420DRAFT_1545760 [Desarmillaria tabescens]KAK0457987.1 hypothetical protein EV420DRAFT_1545760 [Desarmillaria tabescens]